MPQLNSLLLRSSWGGVSKAFSKTKMDVSTCPPLFKILAQSFITVVNWVSQLCLFLDACCLSEKSLYSSRWAIMFERTMCSRTCKVRKSVRRDDNYMRKSCHPFYKGDIYLQETILLGISPVSRDFWKKWAKTGPNSVPSSFKTLGWSSSGPKILDGFKLLRSLITPSFETTMSSMKGIDLLRNGTSLWSLLLSTSVNWPFNSSACSVSEAVIPVPPLLFRGGIPWLSFFLTIDVPIEVCRICLNIADQVIYIQIVLLPNVILTFPSQSFKFWPEFLTARLFCFSMSFVSSANLLISEVIQDTEETVRLALDGMCLSAESWLKK